MRLRLIPRDQEVRRLISTRSCADHIVSKPARRHERGAIPAGNVSGVRNRRHLTGLAEWNWIRQAKADNTLVFSTRTRAWPRFSSDPWHWFGGPLPLAAADLTPLESLSLRIGTGPNPEY